MRNAIPHSTRLWLILPVVAAGLVFTGCRKKCRPSTTDCSAIRYACQPGEEVCGCDGKTYGCALDAECSGGIADYEPGGCP